MKGKYFKLKCVFCVFLSFIVIGSIGSFYLVSYVEGKTKTKIESESKLTSLEILKTDKEIKSIDLLEYKGKVIEVSKSDDGFNHIIVETKPKYIQNNAFFDKKVLGKVNVISKSIFTNKMYKAFSKFEEVFDRALVDGEITNIFGKRTSLNNKEKIILKLKNPIELRFNKNLFRDKENFDFSLIKNEFSFDLYKGDLDGYGLIYEINKNDLFNIDEFKIKNFSDEVLNIGKFAFKDVKIETSKIKKLKVGSLAGVYNRKNDDLITIDCKNVEKVVEINLEELCSNINIVNAKSVILNKISICCDFLINYKVKDDKKSLKISKNIKNKKENIVKTITIDSNEIFRSNVENLESDFKYLDKIK